MEQRVVWRLILVGKSRGKDSHGAGLGDGNSAVRALDAELVGKEAKISQSSTQGMYFQTWGIPTHK